MNIVVCVKQVPDTKNITGEAMKRRNWVGPGLEINSSSAMLDAIRLFKVRGPLWKLMKNLSRSHHRPLR